jgi:hypothetical protein
VNFRSSLRRINSKKRWGKGSGIYAKRGKFLKKEFTGFV